MDKEDVQHCKNCSTEIEGEFCHFCGQRYHDHKESFGELVYEFTSDFLHFDSRFFKTVLPLIFLPGKLTQSYNEGKQRSQFHPIRLYLFCSFVYFFLFFSFNNFNKKLDTVGQSDITISSTNPKVKGEKKSTTQLLKTDTMPAANRVMPGEAKLVSSKQNKKKFTMFQDSTTQYGLTVTPYLDSLLNKKTNPAAYLAQQKTLDKKHRDGYFARIITIRLLSLNLQGEESKKEFFKKIIETFLHNIPKMLFFLLPVFALLLKLLYIRRKEFYYVDHAILSLHYFSLIFLLLIFSKYLLDKIFSTSIFSNMAVIWMMLYLLLAMKKLYKQSWKKTILKYLALGFLFLITVSITILGNLAISALLV